MHRGILTGILAAALSAFAGSGAQAIEIQCIEASRYKNLYRIFGDNPRKFAEYLQIESAQAPNPDFCRAALVTGGVKPVPDGDADKLAEFIVRNRGWLAELHLSSTGGSTASGLRMGIVTRTFWLKAVTASATGGNFVYVPDFFVPPLPQPSGAAASNDLPDGADISLKQGWQNFVELRNKLPPVKLSLTACVSACTFIHAAGIDRSGIVHVHRARFTGENSFIDLNRSMSSTNESLMRGENMLAGYYRYMDAGQELIRTYQATPPETTTPVEAGRYPRYVADYLNARCKLDAGQLHRLEQQTFRTLNYLNTPAFGLTINTGRLREAVQKIREQRGKAEQCVASAHEKERLAAFEKMCGSGCDQKKIAAIVQQRFRDIEKAAQ